MIAKLRGARRGGRILVLVLTLLCAMACAASGCARQRARSTWSDGNVPHDDPHQRAARQAAQADLSCPSVQVWSLGPTAYRVTGCQQFATYRCVRARGRVTCDLSQRGQTAPSSWSDDVVRALGERLQPDVLACATDVPAVVVEVAISPRGIVRRRSGGTALDDAAQRCIDARLEREQLPGSVIDPRIVTMRFTRAPVEEDPPQAPATSAAPEARGGDPAAAVRAALDAQSAAILGCTGRSAVPLRVRWDAAGALGAEIQSASAAADERECVAAIVAAIRIPAPGAPGELLHALHR